LEKELRYFFDIPISVSIRARRWISVFSHAARDRSRTESIFHTDHFLITFVTNDKGELPPW